MGRGKPPRRPADNYAELLVSFARRSGGRLDMFYLVDKGEVIFDRLDDKPLSPTWGFK